MEPDQPATSAPRRPRRAPTYRPGFDTAAHARHAARGRWGAPRRLRLDNLTDAQREAVVNLVASMEQANKAVSR